MSTIRYAKLRNKPCPCGSGIKMKRCCGFAGPAAFDARVVDPSEIEADLVPIDLSRTNSVREVKIESADGPGTLVLSASATEVPAATMAWLGRISVSREVTIDGVTVCLDEHGNRPLKLPERSE